MFCRYTGHTDELQFEDLKAAAYRLQIACRLTEEVIFILCLNLSLSLILRPTISRPACLGIKHPIWGLRPDFYYSQSVVGFLVVGRSL
jgi:hypothetical protein